MGQEPRYNTCYYIQYNTLREDTFLDIFYQIVLETFIETPTIGKERFPFYRSIGFVVNRK